jgi:hypothetical protein
MTLLIQGIWGYSQSNETNATGQDASEDINTITTAVPFLMITPDTRSGGMGDVGVASTPDAASIHWNTAKLAFIDQSMGMAVSYTPWLRALVPDINLGYLSLYKRLSEQQTLAASLLYFSLGEITFTNNVGNTIGQYTPHEYAVDLAFAQKMGDYLSGGVALRYIFSNLTGGIYVGGTESHSGQSIAADISIYFHHDDLEIAGRESILAFGMNISNVGSKMSYTETAEKDYIPINLRMGTGLTTHIDEYNSFGFYFDVNKLLVPTPPVYAVDTNGQPIYDALGEQQIEYGMNPDVPIAVGMYQSFYDAPGGWKEELHEITLSTGMEYWYDEQFAVRAGYFHEHYTKGNRKFLTLGAGLRYNVFGLDFAYLIPTEQQNPLEGTLRFTLTFDFDAFKNQNK